jgi:thiol-disulfide isomerase/thioredoxin
MKYVLPLIACLLMLNCQEEKQDLKLKEGIYRGVLELKDAELLPFNFEVKSDSTLVIFNAEERIEINEILYKNDSVFIKFPVFEGVLAAKFENDNLNGVFIKESVNRIVPFSAEYNNSVRFFAENATNQNVEGIWETVFSEGTEDAYIAKGIFYQKNNHVTGTFRTTTGDYRFLDGVIDGDTLKLSAFDGSHAFYFKAKVTDSTMDGYFYSGNHWKEPFNAKINPGYELPDANSLTYLNEGFETFDFSFPDAEGTMMSINDALFEDKVVVVQLMGTWCPNCLDESRYFSEYIKNSKPENVQFVALAFEYDKTPEKAFEKIDKLKNRFQLDYPILLAQYGGINKTEAQQKLPMLNHVLSYPTTIIIDKTGAVRKIHTGFNGPATGNKFTEFKNEFESFLAELVAE